MQMNEAAIRAVNPDIIYFSSTGYGDSGPFVGKAMHAGTASAAVGSLQHQASFWMDPARCEGLGLDDLEALASHFGTGANGDAASAASAASALSLAILAKKRFGVGQYVRTTMLAGNAYSYSEDFNSYEGKSSRRPVDPEQLGASAVYRLYPAAHGWVFLATPRQSEWDDFCRAAQLDWADDPRFTTPEARQANDDLLAEKLATLFGTRVAEDWESLLAPKGVGCVAVFTASMSEFACTDPAVRETGQVVEVDHPIFGRFLRHGLPQRFSETPGRLGTGCWAGQHTHAVLTELGYSAERIAQLEADGITAVRRDQRAP
jgi:crotonobetainyl-CoA:carnitine CoA-transferase CaiB-like acyl-CoA transferase